MLKPNLHIIKIGGQVIDNPTNLAEFINRLSTTDNLFILVHGGGTIATDLCKKLNIEVTQIEGRRVTDAATLDVTSMVYCGLVNKKIVALLQANGKNAIGLCGADGNLIPADKRLESPINYGFVGDVQTENINVKLLQLLLTNNMLPVIAPITHNNKGQLLNTNADTIASTLAIKLSTWYNTNLHFCFEKDGVLLDVNNPASLIKELNKEKYEQLKLDGAIHSGMIPKIDNAFNAISQGVLAVYIRNANTFNLNNIAHDTGTKVAN
jgi:acetylglutamate kinase